MFEHKNTILAIVLSLIVVVGWQYFVGYPQMQKQHREAQLKQQEQSQVQPATRATSAAPATPGAQPGSPAVPGRPAASAAPLTLTREAVVASSPHVAIDTPRLSGTGRVAGWINTKMLDETGDAAKSQGWLPFVVDTNGNGKRDD